MSNRYPHLIETTTSDYSKRTYMIGPDVSYSDLTEEEKRVVERSKAYIEWFEIERGRELLELARRDFERLRDIPNMPDEAIRILREWTTRDDDPDDDYDYE